MRAIPMRCNRAPYRYEGPNVKGKSRVFALEGKTSAQAMLVKALGKFGVDVDTKAAGYYLEEMRYKQRARGAAPSPAGTPEGSPKVPRKSPKKEKKKKGGGSKASLRKGVTGTIAHASMALPPSPASALTPMTAGLTTGGGKGPTFKVLSTRKVKKKEKLSKLRATQMTGTPEGGYYALFLRCAAHELMIQKGTGEVTVYAGAGLSCGSSQHTMQATLRDKAENVIDELRDSMKIMIPAKHLELREMTCVGETVSSRVIGAHEPIIKGLLKHVNSHINAGTVRVSIHERGGASFHNQTKFFIYVEGLPKNDAVAEETLKNMLSGLEDITSEVILTVGKHGSGLISVVGVDQAQTTTFALQSLQLKARFVSDILAETFTKERAKSDNVPLLVCVNGKSGGGQGVEVLGEGPTPNETRRNVIGGRIWLRPFLLQQVCLPTC